MRNGLLLFIKVILLSLLLITQGIAAPQGDPRDPFEPLNRQVFQFNHDTDEWIIKPVASLYKTVTPWPVRDGVTHFFSNLNDIPTTANDLLQLNFLQALSDTWRFVINSTIGIGGIIDVASKIGLPKHQQDFGLTLARWGWQNSAYVVLPFLGSSTLRDTIGIGTDYYGLSVYPRIKHRSVRYSLIGLNVTNLRANLIGADDIANAAAVDPYVFFRDAFFQHRQQLIASKVAIAATALPSKPSPAPKIAANDDVIKAIAAGHFPEEE